MRLGRYEFDLNGFLLLPGLLSSEELGPIIEHQLAFRNDRDSLPPEQRDWHGGASVRLLDHPAIVGVLNEVLSHQGLATEDCYGFRYDHTGLKYREAGKEQPGADWAPHGGGGLFNFRGNSHIYQMEKNHVHAGLVRVVWELTEVTAGSGGTHFIPGSHKAAFVRPPALSEKSSELWRTYSCPAGSAIVFTESITHTATEWVSPWPRIALFTCYDTVNSM